MSAIERLLLLSGRIYEHRWITAIRRGLLFLFPLIIIGSFATLLRNLPLKVYQDFLTSSTGSTYQMVLEYIANVSYGVLDLCLVLSVSYSAALEKSSAKSEKINPIIAASIAFISFVVLANSYYKGLFIDGSRPIGLFLAIVIAIISTEFYIFLYKSRYLNFKGVKLNEEPAITQALLSVIPSLIIVAFSIALNLFVSFSGFENTIELLNNFMLKIFFNTSDSIQLAVVFNLINQILWFLGIHGNIVLFPVTKGIFNKDVMVNADAVTAGQMPVEIFNKPFNDVFVLIGGSGATLCLLIAVFIASRRSNTVQLARISLMPAVFNINEIIILGLPIVLNPIFLIPFLIVPIILTLIAYAAILAGVVPPVTTAVDWTTPPLLNAFLATGSWKGLALQLFNIFLGTIMYLPFVKLNEIQKDKEIKKTFEKLIEIIEKRGVNSSQDLLGRNDRVGNLARNLSKEIKEAISEDGFLLEYQPQINNNGDIAGVEALLRWPHYKLGRIPPLVIVAIAEEAGLINDLGRWVLSRACCQLADWNAKGVRGLRMSVNISPNQLHDDVLPEILIQSIKNCSLNPADIELEITESVALDLDSSIRENITTIKDAGVSLAMDDFGMGYTSLLYIRYFNINTIKIDGSLTRDLLKDKNCQDIISSMVYLCNTMHIKVIAEYVDTEGQKELLNLLGCREYQGYLFSPPLPSDKCFEYISNMKKRQGINA